MEEVREDAGGLGAVVRVVRTGGVWLCLESEELPASVLKPVVDVQQPVVGVLNPVVSVLKPVVSGAVQEV